MSSVTAPPPGGTTDPATQLAQLISLISGVTGGSTSDANKVADAADPYRSQRAQWQQPIVDLMNNPSSILQDPTFKASLDLGLEGVDRTMGAQGMSDSGNKLAALQQYGQTAASSAIQTKLSNLEDLAGVKSGSPAAAAQAIQAGQTNTAASIAAGLPLIGGLINSIWPQGVPAAISTLFKQMGITQDPSGTWTEAGTTAGPPDPTGTAVDTSGAPDPAGALPPGGVDTLGGVDTTFPMGPPDFGNVDDPFEYIDNPFG